jgi:glutamine synthetase
MEQLQGARLGVRIKSSNIQTVFSLDIMQQLLPLDIIKEFEAAQQGQQRISINALSKIAEALKIWALENGATHFSHWFLPLRSTIGTKEEAFAERLAPNTLVNLFSAYSLLMSETDGSSFPNGNLRQTAQARGYVLWDVYNPPFLEKLADRTTLYIPALFYSVEGKSLDYKIPLLRSEDRLCKATMRLLQLLDVRVRNVMTTLGIEQEFFLIDAQLVAKRPDLRVCDRTLFGASALKDQQFSDLYYAPMSDRVRNFMDEVDRIARQSGIILKTRHREVAPQQYELTAQYSRSIQASSQNSWLMYQLETIAPKYGLAAILHEKPFHGVNGSGKHCNWSLATDMGLNLLDPSNDDNKGNFPVLLAAVLQAIATHNGLLRAAIGSYGNDFRLGGHEAPPAIMAVHLGQGLTEYLREYELTAARIFIHRTGLTNNQLPFRDVLIDLTERNRTSPFVFTNYKFEFRAVGSQAHTAHAVTILNTIVAQSIEQLTEELQESLAVKPRDEAISELVRTTFRRNAHIICNGNNYSESWHEQALERGLKNYPTGYEAFAEYENQATIELLNGVLTPDELAARKRIFKAEYEQTAQLEANTALMLFYQHIVPVCTQQLEHLSKTLHQLKSTGLSGSKPLLEATIEHIDLGLAQAYVYACRLEDLVKGGSSMAESLAPVQIREELEGLRFAVDMLEKYVPAALWPLPTYDQLLQK